jgi:FMN phosphatase YigB (HAD superfamily)
VSAAGYRAILFDLFGTLVTFDPTALPEVVVGGRRVRATVGAWSDLVTTAIPGLDLEHLWEALVTVSGELDRERTATAIEHPSRERFRRMLLRLGCSADAASELGAVCARAHMRVLAAATRFPPEHARLLADVATRRRLGVITNFDDTATAYEILDRHGILRQVGTVVVSEAVGLRKPHGVLVRMALRDLDADASEAVMIGDHAREDVGAAAAAGVDAVWIDVRGEGVAPDAPRPRWVVRTLPEVTAIV